MKNPIAT